VTSKAQPRKKPSVAVARPMPKWVPWAALGLVVITLVLLAAAIPARLWALLTARPFKGEGTLSLTILHTNDTWGYVYPCG